MKRALSLALGALLVPVIVIACIFPEIWGRGFEAGAVVYYAMPSNLHPTTAQCIRQGFAKWNGLNGVYFTNEPGYHTAAVDVRYDDSDPDPGQYASFEVQNTNQTGHVVSGTIWMEEDWGDMTTCLQVQSIIMHEVGHGFGLDNIDVPWSQSIMGATVSLANLNYDWSPSECDWRRATEADTFIGPPAPPDPLPERCTKGGDVGRTDSSGCCNLYFELQVSPSGNFKPSAHIMAPLNNTVLPIGAGGQMKVDVQDVDGSVYRVDWFINGVYNHTTFSAPFSASYANAPAGTYTIQAAAYDHAQEYTLTTPVTITVGNYFASDTLQPGGFLYPGQVIVAANQAYYAQLGADGNMRLLTAGGALVAQTGTSGPPAYAHVHQNGNFTINMYPGNPQVAWQTFTGGIPNVGAGMRVLNSGKVAIIRRDGTTAWQYP